MNDTEINMKFKTHKISKNVQVVSMTRVKISQPLVELQRKKEQINRQPIRNYNSSKSCYDREELNFLVGCT
jgi:hypothetical protein